LLLAISFNADELPAADGSATQNQILSGTGKDDGVLWDFFTCTPECKAARGKKSPCPPAGSCRVLESIITGRFFRARNNGEDVSLRPGFASEQANIKTEFYVPTDWQGKVVRIVLGRA